MNTLLPWYLQLKQEREKRGLSQAELAKQLRSDVKTVNRWEMGRSFPSPRFQKQLVHLFNKSAEELGLCASEQRYQCSSQRTQKETVYRGDIPVTGNFFGRTQELTLLKRWLLQKRCQVILVYGGSGSGKTSLVAHLIKQLASDFTTISWHSLHNQPSLADLLTCSQRQSDEILENNHNQHFSLLTSWLRTGRHLLVLDDFDSIFQPHQQAGRYKEGNEDYIVLLQWAARVEHQSSLIIISGEKPADFAYLEERGSPVCALRLSGLSENASIRLLHGEGLYSPTTAVKDLVRYYAGNPLVLKLVAETIREVFMGNIATFLQQKEPLLENIHYLLGQQFARLSTLEQEILCWLAIGQEPMSLDAIRKNILSPVRKSEFIAHLVSLRHRSLLEIDKSGLFYLQPLLLEYIHSYLIAQICKEIETEELCLFARHAIILAQASETVRTTQICTLLRPLLQALLTLWSKAELERRLKRLLYTVRQQPPLQNHYVAGNVLNIFVQLETNLRYCDFSYLPVRQAYLSGTILKEVNFAYADLTTSVFHDLPVVTSNLNFHSSQESATQLDGQRDQRILSLQREATPYAGMNITGIKGLTASQILSLKRLGAVEHEQKSA